MQLGVAGLWNASLQEKLRSAEALLETLSKHSSPKRQGAFLRSHPLVVDFLQGSQLFAEGLEALPLEKASALMAVIALGQANVVFQPPDNRASVIPLLEKLAEQFCEVEEFYQSIGGVVGYYVAVLRKIEEKLEPGKEEKRVVTVESPRGIDLRDSHKGIWQTVLWGLETLPLMAEIWPIGGAGDRLGLIEEATGAPLPAACLEFGDRTLLEGLVRDLQARESLAYKLFGKQHLTPVALMTSHDKRNQERILEICEQKRWFGRPRESFFFFTQGLVPVITKEGNWAMGAPLRLARKPGGHGVIWRLMRQQKVYDWLKSQGRTKALVRQINNPLAGLDHGLLAFTGYGCHLNKQFGFAACEREVGTAEGVNVFFEQRTNEGYGYGISNIEYTEFDRFGIEDAPSTQGSPYSKFPSNTNILFVDLDAVEWLSRTHPVPGMVVNIKTSESYLGAGGVRQEINAGRLESTMQNIADYLVTSSQERKTQEELNLPTYLTFNARHKTISVTKNLYKEGGRLPETPQGAYLDLQRGYLELLASCEIWLPKAPQGRAPHISLAPALGPLWSTIRCKIQGGSLKEGAELQLDIDQLFLRRLHLQGSLFLTAQEPLGHLDGEGELVFSNRCGKCQLVDCRIENAGINYLADNQFWSNEIERHECCEIILQGSGEFYAKEVIFRGNQTIIAADGERVTATQDGASVLLTREPIDQPSWSWQYAVTPDHWITSSFSTDSSWSR